MKHNQILGNQGEELAANFLKKNKYKIINRNYRTPYGEIDIIARKNKLIVFVEVKTRSTTYFGSGLEAITRKKYNTMCGIIG